MGCEVSEYKETEPRLGFLAIEERTEEIYFQGQISEKEMKKGQQLVRTVIQTQLYELMKFHSALNLYEVDPKMVDSTKLLQKHTTVSPTVLMNNTWKKERSIDS